MEKPSGCIVILVVDRDNLGTVDYAFFGGNPGEPLPDITSAPRAKHTRGDSTGNKTDRRQHRKIKLSLFEKVHDIEALAQRLFGPQG